jgi:hypothetical protein
LPNLPERDAWTTEEADCRERSRQEGCGLPVSELRMMQRERERERARERKSAGEKRWTTEEADCQEREGKPERDGGGG